MRIFTAMKPPDQLHEFVSYEWLDQDGDIV